MHTEEVQKWTRREFLKTSSAAAVAVGMGGIGMSVASVEAQEAAAPVPAGERIVLGFIGVAGRGSGLMNAFMAHEDVEVGAICDVYDEHLNAALERAGGQAKGYKDFRKLLEQKDIDAVVVATPPHWHALISIHACEAGKDVYCEKPMCLYPAEGRAMAKAARNNDRVTQIGTQVHAGDNFRRAVEIVRSGMLGKIMSTRVICTLNEYPGGIGHPADSEPPEGLDWDMWCGPASLVPFNTARFQSGCHRYFKQYAGSWLNELGPHIADLAFWALELGEPTAVSASGGRFVADDISDIPDTMDVLWEYPGMTLNWIHTSGNSYNFDFGGPPNRGRRLGVMFHGTKGTLLADYGSHRIVSEADALKDVPPPEPSIPSSPGHEREFLDAIKTREQPPCNFDYHLPLATALNLGHIALDTGRKLYWDSKKGEIVGDREANGLIRPKCRKPWKLPKA